MASLSGATIATTFKSLLKLAGNTDDLAAGGSTAIQVMTGDGENTPIYLNTDRVGIGTATPQYDLQVSNTTTGQLALTRVDDAMNADVDIGEIYFGASGTSPDPRAGAKITATTAEAWGSGGSDNGADLEFYTCDAGTNTLDLRMIIQDNGKVGIGTASPGYNLVVEDTTANSGGTLALTCSETTVVDTNVIGRLMFRGRDTDTYTTGAKITAIADETWGVLGSDDDDAPTQLRFFTQSNGNGDALSSPRMIIDSDGKVGIGTADPSSTVEIEATAGNADLTVVGTDGSQARFNLWADDGDDATDGWQFHASTNGDLYINKSTGNLASSSGLGTFGDTIMTLDANGNNVGIGETSPDALLQIAQIATDDDPILKFVSADVSHGMTGLTETDVYGEFQKAGGDAGGLLINGYRDTAGSATSAMVLTAYLGEAGITTKSAVGYGIARVRSYIKTSATGTNPGADQNLLSIESASNVRFIFDQEGEMHSDEVIGVGNDWDEWSDLQMASDLSRLPKAKFNEMMKYSAKDFEKAGLLTLSVDEEGNQHAFIRHKAMLMFAMCCFGETYNRISALEEHNKLLEEKLLNNKLLN